MFTKFGILQAILLIGMVMALLNCKKSLSLVEYNAYLSNSDNGLTHTLKNNSISVTCTYHPTSLLVMQDLAGRPATIFLRDSLARFYTSKTYLVLTLSHQGSEIENEFISNPIAYQQWLSYLNTGIATDSFISTNSNNLVAATNSIYIQRFGTSGHSKVLLVFDNHQLDIDKGFYFTLRGYRMGSGIIQFHFTGHDLAALPKLKFN